MTTHVPNTHDANLTALNYFITQKSEKGAALAWSKKPSRQHLQNVSLYSLPDRFRLPHEAWAVFHLQPAGETAAKRVRAGKPQLVFNPHSKPSP
jgi:hypothetical protein